MKAIFFDQINDRLVQVDQREIPDNHGVYWKTAIMEPIKAFLTHEDKELKNEKNHREKIYVRVAPPVGKHPAIFILDFTE